MEMINDLLILFSKILFGFLDIYWLNFFVRHVQMFLF
jgi:hypothetical protein